MENGIVKPMVRSLLISYFLRGLLRCGRGY